MTLRPDSETPVGTPVLVDYRKWVDGERGETSEHWQEPTTFLGTDQYGIWLALPTGTLAAKPTFEFRMPYPHVKIITDDGWAANLSHPPDDQRRISIYVDMVTEPVWSTTERGYHVTMIDLDLDVIEFTDGTIMIDDEDEFAEHQVVHHYLEWAITLARTACAEVEQLLRTGQEPLRAVADRWLALVTD